MERLCANCEWYRRIDADVGTCRGALPIVCQSEDETEAPYGVWGTVEPTDVCAAHRFPRRRLRDELALAVAVAVERRGYRRRVGV